MRFLVAIPDGNLEPHSDTVLLVYGMMPPEYQGKRDTLCMLNKYTHVAIPEKNKCLPHLLGAEHPGAPWLFGFPQDHEVEMKIKCPALSNRLLCVKD